MTLDSRRQESYKKQRPLHARDINRQLNSVLRNYALRQLLRSPKRQEYNIASTTQFRMLGYESLSLP